MSIFTNTQEVFGLDTEVTRLFTSVKEQNFQSSALSSVKSFAIESFGVHQVEEAAEVRSKIAVMFGEQTVGKRTPDGRTAQVKRFTHAQVTAAEQAAIIAQNPAAAAARKLYDTLPEGIDPNRVVSISAEHMGVSDFLNTRYTHVANEAYDERNNRDAISFSITYNIQVAQQDEFGEAQYPTITLAADQAGITIATDIIIVKDNVDRDISGKEFDLRRVNLLRAATNPNILKGKQTNVVPIYRAQSAAVLTDPALLPTKTIVIDGETLETTSYAFRKSIDVLAISQSAAMIATGNQNETDTLESAIDVTSINVQIGTGANKNILKLNLSNLPYFNYVPSVQGDYKAMNLNGETTSVPLNKNTRQYDPANDAGQPLVGNLAAIVTNDFRVRLAVELTGKARVDTANVSVYLNVLKVHSITDSSGRDVPLTDPRVTGFVADIEAVQHTEAQQLGYDLTAYRSNQNRRQSGQLLDIYRKYQRYMVPSRSPMTARHPSHIDSQVDASDIQALIMGTRIKIHNDLVTFILRQADLMKDYIDVRDYVDEAPEILGVGRDFVRPVFLNDTFDAATDVDSLTSSSRYSDIGCAIVNKLRNLAFTMYRDSEYKVAADQLLGGLVPTIVIATDPYTARYINTDGDLRTLNQEFHIQIVTTQDFRFHGKIVMTFAVFNEDRNSKINPLNNGNFIWSPEVVLTANLQRQGAYNRETTVQPRYLFIQNLPVMAVLEVANIPNALGKLPLNIVDVSPVTP